MKLEYSSDYLHLNNAGYQVLNRELEELLKEQDKQKQPTK
jgi:lysophospholipase L1-like esterase